MKQEKIDELEEKRKVIFKKFKDIINQPLTSDSIDKAKTTGVEILGEIVNSGIMQDIKNWDDDSKLSDTALKFKKSIKDIF